MLWNLLTLEPRLKQYEPFRPITYKYGMFLLLHYFANGKKSSFVNNGLMCSHIGVLLYPAHNEVFFFFFFFFGGGGSVRPSVPHSVSAL